MKNLILLVCLVVTMPTHADVTEGHEFEALKSDAMTPDEVCEEVANELNFVFDDDATRGEPLADFFNQRVWDKCVSCTLAPSVHEYASCLQGLTNAYY